ncbi:cob(I)yrinic acid a,c-diamide adenosyltransferase [Tepidibacillus fermentans]|uniref:Corrinoid adenosyltransferase n=1 Tax=Tepidibacillus fermentans TaxID=1281767 RepID=A0A4R3KGN1_9BACI|nr:cob(I)yrinic acid a,c-diamide adenosyltransferase [Tepidibacillus fermentans]TCS82594.1 cob(I)alamin adenosyltransferase [Tepidibacillus fermentans]
MKIYTKTGDQGYTSLTGGERVEKNNPHVEAYGTVDEANSMIGLAIAKIDQIEQKSLEKIIHMLNQVQQDLFHVGSELSTPKGKNVYWPITDDQVVRLEQFIDELEKDLQPLQQFILPGGSEAGAILHLARTIIRRAERQTIYIKDRLSSGRAITYLNRCSDFLFVAARWVNLKLGYIETPFILPSNH